YLRLSVFENLQRFAELYATPRPTDRIDRVAQQFATLASLPSIAVTTLVALNVIKVSLAAGLAAAAGLLLLNWIGWRLASAMFDRERLIVQRAWRELRSAVTVAGQDRSGLPHFGAAVRPNGRAFTRPGPRRWRGGAG
ncbi:MAG: hypothetical protein JWO79_4772, partial [Actinomycetia bacterium]|nr:hypothetical protein [Actinomycetes bacterium]